MAPLPLIKLAAVLFKELAKPLAGRAKTYAREHPQFKGATMRVGRWWDSNAQRIEAWVARRPFTKATPISDENALASGAELASQTFLVSTALLLVLAEYVRSSYAAEEAERVKAAAKETRRAAKEKRMAALELSLDNLHARLKAVEGGPGLLGTALGRRRAAHDLPLDRYRETESEEVDRVLGVPPGVHTYGSRREEAPQGGEQEVAARDGSAGTGWWGWWGGAAK